MEKLATVTVISKDGKHLWPDERGGDRLEGPDASVRYHVGRSHEGRRCRPEERGDEHEDERELRSHGMRSFVRRRDWPGTGRFANHRPIIGS